MAVILRFARISAIFGALFLNLPGTVLSAPFDSEFDEKPWQEIEIQLPPFPEDENLIPFKVGAITDKRFLIDGKSISVGGDEVIRYSVIIISSAGAKNIGFEGMRCSTGERRVYAFGHSDGTWSKARNSKWTAIRGGSNDYPVALYTDYFCPVGQPTVMTPEDAIRALRYGVQQHMGA
ncbi:MAG: CNP1-like family protein [Candidatus Accumulibacter sp.]|nr:CNP1-like family protein [Accumulibacter sp.]